MKMKASAITAAALLALTAQTVSAAEAVGYNVVTVPANSDVLVSVPFNNNVEATFTVETVDFVNGGVTLNETLAADTYNSSYYIRVIDGAGEGLWSTISDNGDGGLEFANTNILSQINGGDTLKVYAHQTLASVFEAGLVDIAFEASTNATLGARKTEVLLPSDAVSINKSSTATHYYISWNHPTLGLIEGWRLSGGNVLTDVGNTVITPDSYIIVRNNGGSELSYISKGDVFPGKLGTVVRTEASQYDINFVTGRPVAVTLDELELDSVVIASANATLGARKDELLVFDNSASEKNKSSASTYYYISWNHPTLGLIEGWRLSGGNVLEDKGSVEISPSSALIIRKAAGNASNAFYTQNAPF